MALTVAEWRKYILEFFSGGGKYDHFICPKETLFEIVGIHLDGNLISAFESLLKDSKLSAFRLEGNVFYGWNLSKIEEIRNEMFSVVGFHIDDIVQPFDKNLSDLNLRPEFESETDRNLPNKGKYYHFTKSNDSSFWVSIVKTKGSTKSRKLVLGTLSDPVHRLCKIRKSIIRVTKQSGEDTFIKQHVEDDEPQACGNSRQYSRAALDILKELGCIIEIISKGRSPVYAITNKIFLNDESFRHKVIRQVTFDEIFENEFQKNNKEEISE